MPDPDPADTADSNSDPYAKLLEMWKQVAYLEDVEELLDWDQYTVMPDEGGPARAPERRDIVPHW